MRQELQRAGDLAAEERSSLAAATAERDAARQDVQREQTHAQQRVQDLRVAYDAQLVQLRADLDRARRDTTP